MHPEYKQNRLSSSHFLPLFFYNRDEIYNQLQKNNVYCGMHYKRNDKYRMYSKYTKINNLAENDWYEKYELTLPMHLLLIDRDLKFICDIINRTVE